MLLSPQKMLTYLEETYTPQEQFDFLMSEAWVQWIHSKLAPHFPIIDASYLEECFELFPSTDFEIIHQTKTPQTGQESRILIFTCDSLLKSRLEIQSITMCPSAQI